jgi:hypothetical protein
MTAGIATTSLVVWPAAPLFLFMHDKDINIPKGTEITAYIGGNMNSDQAKFMFGTPPQRSASGSATIRLPSRNPVARVVSESYPVAPAATPA